MTDSARRTRNAEQLATCYVTFAERIEHLLHGMETRGFRPRVQQAWRSPAEQTALYRAGRTRVQYGFHNVMRNGVKEALAVDILDDDAPLQPLPHYLLSLAIEADLVGCETGIAWGLPSMLRERLVEIIARREPIVDAAGLKLGWDPCHVQPKRLTITAVRRGARPIAFDIGGPR